jgi:hypothetical protein
MNYEKKYIKYKQKYIDLKNKQQINVTGGNPETNVCLIDKHDLRMNKISYCYLPLSIQQLFISIAPGLNNNFKLIKTKTGSNLVELFSKFKIFVTNIIIIVLFITLMVKKIYIFNHYVKNFTRDPIEKYSNDYNKFYNELKENNFVSKSTKKTKDTSLKIVLREYRLFTVGTGSIDVTTVQRKPSANDDNLQILFDAISNLIFDFRISFATLFYYIFDTQYLKYFNSKSIAVFKKIFEMLQKSIDLSRKPEFTTVTDFTGTDKIADWVIVNQKILDEQKAKIPYIEKELIYQETVEKKQEDCEKLQKEETRQRNREFFAEIDRNKHTRYSM